MHSRIEWFAGLEHAVGDMKELSHHGADDQLARFACVGEALAKDIAPRRAIQRHHGGHVQRLAHETVADLGQARLAFHAAARLVLPRVQAGEGNSLSGISESFWIRIEGQQHGDRALTYSGDRFEQVSLVVQVRVVVDVLVDGLYQRLNLPIEPGQMFGDARMHGGPGDLQAIALLGAHVLQRLQAQYQRTQGLLGRTGCLPWSGVRSQQN